MNKCLVFVLVALCFPIFAFSDFNELGKNPKALENHLDFSNSSLQVVQKRWLPRKFLSELSVGLSPSLKGFNYINNYSLDLAYRFFLNDYWSIGLNYSFYFNPITEEGKDELTKRSRIPLELKYYQKQSFLGGVSWYPFYGKAVFYNHLIRFDLYLSALAGLMELMHLDQRIPTGSMGLGLVCWWHKNFNSRLEVRGVYYRYNVFDNTNETENINEYVYSVSFSIGVLF